MRNEDTKELESAVEVDSLLLIQTFVYILGSRIPIMSGLSFSYIDASAVWKSRASLKESFSMLLSRV